MSNQTGTDPTVGSSAWLGRLLCRLGAHKWGIVGYNSILNPMPVEQCGRCKIGRQFHPAGAEFYYSAEQMRGPHDGDPVENMPDVTGRPNGAVITLAGGAS